MGTKISLRTIWITARVEYIKWLFNPRIIIVAVMMIFIKTLAIEPLLERAIRMNEPINILEPFIAVGNSGMLIMILPAVYLTLMSDFPIIGGNTLFFIRRTGKVNWFFGQLLFAIMSIFTYLIAVFGFCMLFTAKYCYVGENWSKVVRQYDAFFPEEAGNFASLLLPSNLYNQIDIIPTLLHTFVLTLMYLFLLTLILFMFKILYLRMAGLFTSIILITFGVATCSIKTSLMWIFPMANTIIWLHYTEIRREPIKTISYSYVYFVFLIIALIVIDIFTLKRANFYTVEES